MKDEQLAETIGSFRELLSNIAAGGEINESEYSELRKQLMSDERVSPLLPDFIIECRTWRDFWNYIRRSFDGHGVYGRRSIYIEGQLLPIERQFRPERQKAPGNRPAEVRIEYSPVRPVSSNGLMIVAEERLAELRTTVSPRFDLRKLIRLCEELNVAYSEGCYYTTIMATRSLLDHVPPLFGKTTFSDVANHYSGGRSFKQAMQHLDSTARAIADGHLHTPIRKSEVLPTRQQVNFTADLDVLLAEIVRVLP